MTASSARDGSPELRPDLVTRRRLLRDLAVVGAALVVPRGADARAGEAGGVVARAAHGLPATRRGAEVALAWFDQCQGLIQHTPGYSPPVASRVLAYLGVALYEAIVPSMPGFKSLQGELAGLDDLPRPASRSLDWEAVANAVLARAVRRFFTGVSADQRRVIDRLENSFVPADSPRAIRSVRHGWRVADAIYQWSTADGGHRGEERNFPADYVPPRGSGLWEPTPPGYQRAMQPAWGRNRTFVLPSSDTCAPPPPTPWSSSPASTFHDEALEVHRAVVQRTREQEAIAAFWSDDPGSTSTPPGHSISILTQVLADRDASLAEAAEAYAKVGVALADAFIACWDTKYQYNLIRPVTYIHRHIDAAWRPILDTPPFPEFTSGHSVQSGAGFRVMADLFGDRTAFVDHTHDSRGLPPRSFTSFSACADEAAISRLYGGIHFRPAIDLGVDQGRCIGRLASALPTRRPKAAAHSE